MPVIAPLLVLTLAPGALRFMGNPHCPDNASVEAQLRSIDPGALDATTGHLVMIEEGGGGLRVRLFDNEGRTLGERFLSGPLNCEERARFAAAVLATWETDLAVSNVPAASGVPPGTVPAPRADSGARETAPSKAPEDQWRGEVGIGISGSLASNGSFAPGGEVVASLAPPHGPFGGELILTGTGFRSIAVSQGAARWQRVALGLGGQGTLGSGALRLELGGAFLFGLLSLKGSGFTEQRSSSVFDPGIGISGRGLWRWAPAWVTWVRVDASFWPKVQEVNVLAGGSIDTAVVPPFDFSVSLGLSLALGPAN